MTAAVWVTLLRVGERAGDAEVHHLHRAGLADHDVGGLDVAVDDAVLVAEVQRLARVGDHLDGALRLHRAVGVHDVAQRDAVDVLHHDVGQRPVRRLRLAGVVHRDDRRVVQRGGVLGFAAEPQIEAGIAGQVCAQHLDRDVSVQPHVAGEMDFGHAAEAEDLAEFVAVGQVLRGGHSNVCSKSADAARNGADGATVVVSGRCTRICSPRCPMDPSSVQSGTVTSGGAPCGVVWVTVSVIVGGGDSRSFLSWAFSTIRIAMTIARAPSTPAAHSRAR